MIEIYVLSYSRGSYDDHYECALFADYDYDKLLGFMNRANEYVKSTYSDGEEEYRKYKFIVGDIPVSFDSYDRPYFTVKGIRLLGQPYQPVQEPDTTTLITTVDTEGWGKAVKKFNAPISEVKKWYNVQSMVI